MTLPDLLRALWLHIYTSNGFAPSHFMAWGPGGRLKLAFPPPPPAEPADATSNDLASQILSLLDQTEEALMAKQIARRLGKPLTPYVRQVLAKLKEDGFITHTQGEGYRRAVSADDE
jgi:hypothetical protein